MKIKVSKLWLPFFVVLCTQDVSKIMVSIFLMLIIHECAHLFIAHLFHYQLSTITIYPFGLGAQIEHMGHGSVWKECLIIVAGPSMHFLYPFLFDILQRYHFISHAFYQYLCQMNIAILIFNILPIWPLDGGRLMQSVVHLLFSYRIGQILTFILSILNLLWISLYILNTRFSSCIVMLFLLAQTLITWKNLDKDAIAFYKYRLLYPFHGHLKAHGMNDLFRQNENLLRCEKGWMSEDIWIRRKLVYYYQKESNHSTFVI